MRKNLTARTVIIIAVILACVFGIIGFPTSKSALVDNLRRNIRLGLDLKGGSYLVLEVQVQDAAKAEAEQVVEKLKESFRKQNIQYASIETNDPQTVEQADSIEVDLKGVPPNQTSAVRSIVSEDDTDWVLTSASSNDFYMRMKPSSIIQLKKDTVERAIQTINNRINTIGVTEPSVQQYGNSGDKYEILVQLPGVDDPQEVKNMIGTVANLEITAVKDGPYASKEAAMAQHGGVLPVNTVLYKSLPRGGNDEWWLVSRLPVVTGRDVRNARASQGDNMRRWDTNFTLSPEGGKKFANFTEANIGNKLAVVLDKEIVSVATIEARIEDQGRITNLSAQQEAMDLANFLKSGSLPAGIHYNQERSIGPSLGVDSIHAGIVAGLAGLAAVVLVMLLYYKRSGLNAVLALLLNTVVLMAAISYFHAVLTLPGIAGVILTIGMAVDSNVLIFERIREELRTGKSVIAAVDAGFGLPPSSEFVLDLFIIKIKLGFAFKLNIGCIPGLILSLYLEKWSR